MSFHPQTTALTTKGKISSHCCTFSNFHLQPHRPILPISHTSTTYLTHLNPLLLTNHLHRQPHPPHPPSSLPLSSSCSTPSSPTSTTYINNRPPLHQTPNHASLTSNPTLSTSHTFTFDFIYLTSTPHLI